MDTKPFPLNPADFLPDKPTRRGDFVRSKSEAFIANLLHRMGLRYEYERPVRLGNETFVPDFYLPDFDLYVEYYGLLHWKTYERKTARKIELYAKHGIRCMHLFQSMMVNLNRFIRYELNRIESLEEEPYRFRGDLLLFLRQLEEQPPALKAKGKLKWTPMMDRVVALNRRCPANLSLLARIIGRRETSLQKRLQAASIRKTAAVRKAERERREQEAIRERIRKAYPS
jgi:hypothetical protein